MSPSPLWIVLALVALSRLVELIHARRNTARLLDQGGIEHGRAHYPLIVALHAGWLAVLAVIIPPDTPPDRVWLSAFIALQAARVWVIVSLGPYWTTRVISLPGAPLIRRGPYRFLRHPNYLVVVGEIAVLPLAFGAWETALVFSALNGLILMHRIRVEQAALAPRAPITD
ncbi:MAG: isoprenylcysteine carboxylmethyltransferase family protein [Rhodospirillales bacterium]